MIVIGWTRHRNRILGSCSVTSPTSYSAALKRDVFSNLRHLLSVLVCLGLTALAAFLHRPVETRTTGCLKL
ncbi:hypothetical protein RRG08_054153 [Elysia crispata]|uniref:Uncharacterized protein n=1 Tax=Elysia crispata TaxID=231223 RepID=A0AAE0Y7D6_9GAST|nr:hypothetical protein RRG08_054153 [Elysia crispata]